jgi:hypothetical protein
LYDLIQPYWTQPVYQESFHIQILIYFIYMYTHIPVSLYVYILYIDREIPWKHTQLGPLDTDIVSIPTVENNKMWFKAVKHLVTELICIRSGWIVNSLISRTIHHTTANFNYLH